MVALPVGTRLENLVIESVLGQGGFGLTYLANDAKLKKKFAVKEYFPESWASRDVSDTVSVTANPSAKKDYAWGLQRFTEEAQTLAKFRHPAIVPVNRIIEDNGTAYMVLDYEEGDDFGQWLKKIKRPPTQEELDSILVPLLDALSIVHTNNILHRDIAPDNIKIRPDGSPVLLDFGSAREAVSQRSKTISAIIKHGYSPAEQYSSSGKDQGPWTDIYALGATLYKAITGEPPPESIDRLADDDYVPAAEAAKGKYRESFLAAIDHALRRNRKNRPQSLETWRDALFADAPSAIAEVRTRIAPAGGMAVPASSGPARKSSGLKWVAILLAGAVLAGGGYYFSVMQPAQLEAQRAADEKAARLKRDESAWKETERTGTIAAYEAYLDKHPVGQHAEEAKRHIAALELAAMERKERERDERAWKDATGAGTRSALETYLDVFPEGQHAEEAKRQIEALEAAEARLRGREAARRRARERASEQRLSEREREEAAWRKSIRSGSEEAYLNYLRDWHDGIHADEARERLAALRAGSNPRQIQDRKDWQAALKQNSLQGYREYLTKQPTGQFRFDAKQKIDAFERLNELKRQQR